MRDDLLKIYLNDHLAGSVAAVELIERCRANNAESELGGFLTRLLAEIEEDQAVLKELLARFGSRENPAKKAAAWLLEKVGRSKLNDKLFEYSDLSRLEELEALLLGVRGKLALWAALEAVGTDDRFSGIDFDTLKGRARSQHDQIERYRIEAARRAFSPTAG